MRKQRIHLKAAPPNLPSFTACGLWIYEVGKKHPAKQVAVGKKEFKKLTNACKRCRNTKDCRNMDNND